MKYLNIGCGNRFRNQWINIDINPASKYVDNKRADDLSFDYVYKGKKYNRPIDNLKPRIRRSLKKIITLDF